MTDHLDEQLEAFPTCDPELGCGRRFTREDVGWRHDRCVPERVFCPECCPTHRRDAA